MQAERERDTRWKRYLFLRHSQRKSSKKLHNQWRSIKARLATIVCIRIAVRPGVFQIRSVVVLYDTVPPAMLPRLGIISPCAHIRCLVLFGIEAVTGSPVVHVLGNVGCLTTLRGAVVANLAVDEAVELEDGNRQAAGTACGQFTFSSAKHTRVYGRTDGSEGSDLEGGAGVAGEQCGKSGAVGLACGVDAGRVDAVG